LIVVAPTTSWKAYKAWYSLPRKTQVSDFLNLPQSSGERHKRQHGINIRRAKKKRDLQNYVCIKASVERYDAGACTRLQFLRAKSQPGLSHGRIHSPGGQRQRQQRRRRRAAASRRQHDDTGCSSSSQRHGASISRADSVVCMLAPRSGVALVHGINFQE